MASIFDLTNWYWDVADTNHGTHVFSTASGSYVVLADATYVAWVAAGHTATVINTQANLYVVINRAALDNLPNLWGTQSLSTGGLLLLTNPLPTLTIITKTNTSVINVLLPQANMPTSMPIGEAFYIRNSSSSLASFPLTDANGVGLGKTVGIGDEARIIKTSNSSLGGAYDITITPIRLLTLKGALDCSLNQNYVAADAGHVYYVSVAGKIGGALGPNVEVGDELLCLVDGSPSGNHATVGANWNITQVNIDGAYFAGGTDVAVTDGGTGRSTLTSHGILLGEGASAINQTAEMSNGQLLVGQTGADPLPKTISGDVTVAASGAATIANDAVIFAKMQNVATDSLLGRDTAGTGDPENILLNATLSMDGSGNLQRAALTGDVTASAGGNATTIANNAVTNAKAAQMAANTIKGNNTGSTANVADLTTAQLVAMLAATQADQEAATSTSTAVTPARQHNHPSAAKSWALIAVSGGVPSVSGSYNVSSITDLGVGNIRVSLTTSFSSANYAVAPDANASVSVEEQTFFLNAAAGSFEMQHSDTTGGLRDPAAWSAIAFGDQ